MSNQQVPLPQMIEELIKKLCVEKQQNPPDTVARRRLAAAGDEVAMDVLSKIRKSMRPIRTNLSAYIIWMVDNHPQSPSKMTVVSAASPQSSLVHNHIPLRTPPAASSAAYASTPASYFASDYSISPRSGESSCYKSSGHLDRYSTWSSSQIARPNKVSRQLVFSNEPQNVERTSPDGISHQLMVLSGLEFRKFFLLLSYMGRRKLEEVVSPRTAQDIVKMKDLPMVEFESYIWDAYCKDIYELEDRRKCVDWDSGRTHFYYCNVHEDGSYTFKGPCLNTTRTHLQRALGDENVLIVKFVEEGINFANLAAKEGILVGLRRFRFFVFKDESKDVKKKNRKGKNSTDVKCYFVRFDSIVPCGESESYPLSSKKIAEARCLFMHVHMVSSMAKYMARFSLILSKTIKLPVDLSSVRIGEIDDICCHDENGIPLCDENGEPLIHTDGTGFISEDLALKCPQDFGSAKYIKDGDFQKFRNFVEVLYVQSEQRGVEASNREPPLLMQCRLFSNGLAIKGTLLVNRKLAPRTIQIRPSMVKVKRDMTYPTGQTFDSLEIVAVSHRPRKCYLSRNLIALLSYGGVPRNFFLELLTSALEESQAVYSSTRAALKVALFAGEDENYIAARMISGGVPLNEPYLQHRLSRLMKVQRSLLRDGKLPINESFYLMGTADPTDKLNSNQVYVILENGQISGDVLVYRNPGLHFGDIHILEAVYRKDLKDVVGNAKYGIFFSTKGRRSAATEIANGDFDGDMYWVSRNPQLLEYFRASKPWSRTYSTPQPVIKKPNELSAEKLEHELFQLFRRTSAPSFSMAVAADSWLSFMDRLLVLGDGIEKDNLRKKMLKLIDMYYDAIDAPKSGKKVNVPPDFRAEKYPHYMRKGDSVSYHSSSILGEIYDKIQEFQSEERCIGEIWKLPCFNVEVPKMYLSMWENNYIVYCQEMRKALEIGDESSREDAANEVIKKYKQFLYGAEDLQESTKSTEHIYNEALAIYHVAYNSAISKADVEKCGFAWKVAGSALCKFHAFNQNGNPIWILPSILLDIL